MDLFRYSASPWSLYKLGRVDMLLDRWMDSSLIEAYSGSENGDSCSLNKVWSTMDVTFDSLELDWLASVSTISVKANFICFTQFFMSKRVSAER